MISTPTIGNATTINKDQVLGPIKTWSYTSLRTFEECPHRLYLRRSTKLVQPMSPAAERGVAVHEQFEKYVRGEDDVDFSEMVKNLTPIQRDDLKRMREKYPERVEIEEPWAFNIHWEPVDWNADDCWYRLKLDAFETFEEEEDLAFVYDWKTGKKHGNEVKHTQQGQQYAIAAFMRYPHLKTVKVAFVYLDSKSRNHMFRVYDREQAMRYFDKLNARALALTTCTEFPAKPNTYNCKYCVYRDEVCNYAFK